MKYPRVTQQPERIQTGRSRLGPDRGLKARQTDQFQADLLQESGSLETEVVQARL